jgi:HSP20 family protein
VSGIRLGIMEDRRYTMEVSLRRTEERMPSLIPREMIFFSDMERRMEGLFDQVFGPSLVTYVMPETRGVFSPRTDIKETKKDFKIVSEMPGMDPNDIEVSVDHGILTITGEKKVDKEETEGDYHHVERSYGCFTRSITLPDTVDMDHIESTYKKGLLMVTLPKTKKGMEGSKKIPVTS